MRRLGICLVFSAGCATAPLSNPSPRAMLLPDPADGEYAAYRGAGSNVVEGQAFLTTQGGDVKLAAGRTVTLDPATPYAREWYRKYGRNLARAEEAPPAAAFRAARRSTTADAQGKFRFIGLRPGTYIIRTTVTWITGAQYGGLQGGVVSDIVETGAAAESQPVILSRVVYGDADEGVKILAETEIGSKRYSKMRQVSGISCRTSPIYPEATEAKARDDLTRSAGKLEADALINVLCKKGGINWTHNCSSFVECTGDAIRWISA